MIVVEMRQLRVFVAVAHHRSFTAAAHQVHLSQQAVSKVVAQLERELGVTLLHRTTRAVRPTRAGAALLEDAEALLNHAEAAAARARALGLDHPAAIQMAVSPAVTTEEINALISDLDGDGPRRQVNVTRAQPGQIANGLAEATFELALTRTAPPGHDGPTRQLIALPAAAAVARTHRLADRDRLRWSELADERLVVWNPPGTPYTDLLLGLAARHGGRLTPAPSAVIGGQGLPDVAAGRAIALVPACQQAPRGTRVIPLDAGTLPLLACWTPTLAPAIQRVLTAPHGSARPALTDLARYPPP